MRTVHHLVRALQLRFVGVVTAKIVCNAYQIPIGSGSSKILLFFVSSCLSFSNSFLADLSPLSCLVVMAAAVHIGSPPAQLFALPPYSLPDTIPAPARPRSWAHPFDIPPDLYTRALSFRVPVTIAALYAASVIALSRLNARRNFRPWAFSQTRIFRIFVVLHNVFLAAYSTWTFAGMIRAFRLSWPVRGGNSPFSAGLVDAYCRINGPRGLGNATVYDPTTRSWISLNPFTHNSLSDGRPNPMDDGRLWNAGLAYYGWLFYLSKFYEVLDTVIILAKGKKSSTLQTYHHAGAMMCMWAGIRYMASPIWIFALFNSLIHAMMYTYYTLTAISVPVPVRIKRSLTTLQIVQFIIGTSLAAVHLFISYTIPVIRPNPDKTNVVAVESTAAPTSLGFWLKTLTGLSNSSPTPSPSQAAVSQPQYVTEPQTFTCMATTGQAFAVWLNVFYLLPLTYLFARFFVRSYLRRTDSRKGVTRPRAQSSSKLSAKSQSTHVAAEQAGMDAFKDLSREIRNAVNEMHGYTDESEPGYRASGSQPSSHVPTVLRARK